jgi:uncharacterized protein
MQKVLSIDGGGIRGIIPAMVLTEIERRTGKRTAEVFDLAAGTSTGGILALGQTKPGQDGGPEYGAKKLIELYETEGGKIFDRSVWHRIHSVVCLPEERYPSTGIEEVALESFGDVRLAQALTEVLVPSYEIEKRGPWFFKRRNARDPNEGFNRTVGSDGSVSIFTRHTLWSTETTRRSTATCRCSDWRRRPSTSGRSGAGRRPGGV